MSRVKNPWSQLIAAYRGYANVAAPMKVITLAQWALESGRGTSELAQKHNNFAGLKYRARMAGHATPVDYEAHDGVATYCAFKTIPDFITGYWHFIETGPYDGFNAYVDNPIGYIAHLLRKGYAEDPNYVAKVATLQAEAHAALAIEGDDGEPDRPSRAQFGDRSLPLFETLQDVSHTARGARPNGLEGLIVHFDAFRIRRAGNGPEDSDRRTIDMMRLGQKNGYHYGEISRTGRIYLPRDFDWHEWGYHAGSSRCPLTDRGNVSQFYVGIEMNNPGRLYEAQEDGVFCPWYNSKRTETGNVILDARGRCTRISASDEWYTRDEVRFAEGGNIQKGWYLPYSHDQFEALTNLVGFLRDEFFKSFSIDKVFGHDEVSPGRKNDPGGALATPDRLMTMPAFRQYLKERF